MAPEAIMTWIDHNGILAAQLHQKLFQLGISKNSPLSLSVQQSGAVEACWAHNPEVRGSKPRSANSYFWILLPLFCTSEVLNVHPILCALRGNDGGILLQCPLHSYLMCLHFITL